MDQRIAIKTLELISNMMTRTASKVGMSGEEAHTDGRNINLPQLPIDDHESFEMLNGYLDHEDAHVAETDFSIEEANPQVHVLRNVIEDARIEKIHGDSYVGVRQNLVRLTELLVKQKLLTPATESDDPMTLLQKYVNYELLAEHLGYQSVFPLVEETRAVCEKIMPKGMRIRLDAMIPQAKSCRNTLEVTELSRRILKMMDEESKEVPPPENSESGQGGQQSGTGGAGNTSDQDQPQGDGDPSGAGECGSGDANASESGSNTAGSCDADKRQKFREALQSGNAPIQHGIGEAVKEHLQQVEVEAKQEGKPVMVMPIPVPYTDIAGSVDEALYSVDSVSIGLRQRLSGLLLANTRSERRFSTSGKIVPSRLWRLKYGEVKVFERVTEGQKIDTAVSILLDGSSSMAGNEIEIARQACLALSLTLDCINVRNSIGVFSGSGSHVGVVKTFDERTYDIANRLPSIKGLGGTPLYPSMLWAAQGLMQRREPRKIVLIISDGKPRDFASCKQFIDMMVDSGVEVLGVGIKSDMNSLVERSSTIHDINELPTAMFETLEDAMMLKAA